MEAPGARQKRHYETIHDEYERHYYDPASMAFRSRFIYDFMFRDLDLEDKDVGDLASGSGYNSLALLERFPGARVSGFDISERACEAYRRNVGREAHRFDLTSGRYEGPKLDAAFVVGGLHHCVRDLAKTFVTIATMLRPGGLLLMCEPNKDYVLEGLRRLWYRKDAYFEAETEGALSHDQIVGVTRTFATVDVCYRGGPAYFLICNSLVLRIPVGLKRAMAPPLFRLEALHNRLPGRRWHAYFIARWRHTGGDRAAPSSAEPPLLRC